MKRRNFSLKKAMLAAENTAEEPRMPKSKKFLLFGVILLVALIGATFALISGFGGQNVINYGLYVKDGEMYYTNFFSDKPFRLTEQLYNGESNSDLVSKNDRTFLGADGELLFYPDHASDSDAGVSLYYRRIRSSASEPVCVDTDVIDYAVGSAGNRITYLKGSDRSLYQYDLEKREKIADNVFEFCISADGTKVICTDRDGNIYRKSEGAAEKIADDISYISRVSDDLATMYYVTNDSTLYKQSEGEAAEKIDSGVSSVSYVTDDLSALYYIKDNTLYRKTEGKEREEILSGPVSDVHVYDTGEIYYMTFEQKTSVLMDYVQDDMADYDAAVSAPPPEPVRPSRSDYASAADYDAALEAYYTAYKEYREASERYNEKLERDALRDTLEKWKVFNNEYTLHYYDGTAARIVSDKFVYKEYSCFWANHAAAAVIPLYEEVVEPESFLLSEITDASELVNKINSAKTASVKWYVVAGNQLTCPEQKDIGGISIGPDGRTVYFINEADRETREGDLYQIVIAEDGTIGKPSLYSSDVGMLGFGFVSSDRFLYYRNIDDHYLEDYGDLYINEDLIDTHVRRGYFMLQENAKEIVYFTDWDYRNECGTLKEYSFESKESVKIGDGVHSFTIAPNGGLLYLCDYDLKHYGGELCLYQSGTMKKIDEEVSALVSIDAVQYRGSGYSAWCKKSAG